MTSNYDLENGKIMKSENTTESLLRIESQSVRFRILREFVVNVRKVVFETKLFALWPAIPMAFVADRFSFGRVSDQ